MCFYYDKDWVTVCLGVCLSLNHGKVTGPVYIVLITKLTYKPTSNRTVNVYSTFTLRSDALLYGMNYTTQFYYLYFSNKLIITGTWFI